MPDFLQKQAKPNLDYREKIVALAQVMPVQPQSVAKALNTNSILASAMLSELAEKGSLVVSHLKVGSSPLYYIPSDASKLLNYVHVLNEKDQQTLKKLQDDMVLRDAELDPLLRVSLRSLKDFAKSLTVKYNSTQELFWKYFLVEDKIAEEIIKNLLEPRQTPVSPLPAPLSPPPTPIPTIPSPITPHPALASSKHKEINKLKEKTENTPLSAQPQNSQALSDSFSKLLSAYFSKKSISVFKEIMVKRNSENDYVLSIPTPVGKVMYYCKATNKKKATDADISRAFVQGQLKKLPILYLYSGELTPKAKEVLKELQGVTATKL
ncbi:MAG: hypothetical protein HY363_06210 [Candidatus Aenigmarchaeota archaeon]|nr:hypothetical protein [Candidatus Aenigmarchaeota archaeon]